MNKSKIPDHFRFPLANPQKGQSLDSVPTSIVTEDHWFIANLNNQSTIFILNKIDQEQPKNLDKQMLFFHVSNCYLRCKILEGYANTLDLFFFQLKLLKVYLV